VTRFPGGLQHHVYDCLLPDGQRVVARLCVADQADIMRSAAAWSDELRPRGLPLPVILFRDLQAAMPGLLLARLPGTDLGNVIGALTSPQRSTIAREVVAWQQIAAALPQVSGYGYALHGQQPPHRFWSDVLATHLSRSRARFGTGIEPIRRAFTALRKVLRELQPDLRRIDPTPFLHDTTTKNVIVHETAVTGLVDVDDLCHGDPRFAAALTTAALIATGGPLDYVRAWLAASHAEPDRCFALYVALFALDIISESGHRFNRDQPVATEPNPRLMRLLGALVAAASGDDGGWFGKIADREVA